MRYLLGFIFMCVMALGVAPMVGCGDSVGSGGSGGSVGSGGTAGSGGSAFSEAEAAALEALQEYNEAFNSQDEEAWAATLNYPHVRFGGLSPVTVWNTPEEYTDSFDFDVFKALNPGWDHSEWDSIEIVQSGPDKVHIALVFSRYDADGNVLKTFKTFHIMTKQDGHWGTQARSTYADM